MGEGRGEEETVEIVVVVACGSWCWGRVAWGFDGLVGMNEAAGCRGDEAGDKEGGWEVWHCWL